MFKRGCTHGNLCQTCTKKYRPNSAKKMATVKLELREVKEVLMHDENNSAHQFSLHDRSMQADSEERLEAEMQTSALKYLSHEDQTSMQNAKSMNIQTSEIEMRSAKFQAFENQRLEMSCQTDPAMLQKQIPPKNMNVQTERYKDIVKNDWAESSIFRKALRDEASKRGLENKYVTSDEGETSNDSDRSILSPTANYMRDRV